MDVGAHPGIRANAKFNWDAVELPTGPKGMGNWLFWGAYVVNAKTVHPEEAWKLVQMLTTAETQGMISELGTNIPSRVQPGSFGQVPDLHASAEQPGFLERPGG